MFAVVSDFQFPIRSISNSNFQFRSRFPNALFLWNISTHFHISVMENIEKQQQKNQTSFFPPHVLMILSFTSSLFSCVFTSVTSTSLYLDHQWLLKQTHKAAELKKGQIPHLACQGNFHAARVTQSSACME